MADKPVCKYCGKEYKENPFIPKELPEYFKDNIRYIPDCECLEKLKEKELKEAELKIQAECNRNRIKKYKDISLMDLKFLNSTFEKADMSIPVMKMAKKYTEKFIEKGTTLGLFLHGRVGTGKTFASACIANELMARGKTVLVMNFGLYLNKIRRDWAEAERDVLDYVQNCDLLIIDDIGVEAVTDWMQDKLFTLIDTRYRAEKPMIVTTNLELDNSSLTESQIENKLSVESRFNPRISDRISEMCYSFAVVGDSRRAAETKNKFKEFLT